MPLSTTEVAIADIDAQIAEIRLLRTQQVVLPPPPIPPKSGASQAEKDQYTIEKQEYDEAVTQAKKYGQEESLLQGEKVGLKADLAKQNLYDKAYNKLQQGKQGVQRRASTSNKWLANVPTPGGVWLPFGILMFLFLVLFPVAGHTRLKWFFLVLLKQAGTGDHVSDSIGSKVFGNSAGSSGTTITDLSSTNTNPNVSPSQVITSMPPPIIPTQKIVPFTIALNDAGTTSYVSSLFSSFGEF